VTGAYVRGMATVAFRPPSRPLAAVAPRPFVLGAIGALGVTLVATTTALGFAHDEFTTDKLLLYQWMSAPYIVAGVVAWWRRPESRLGPLMVAGGVGAALSGFQAASPDVLFTLGAALDILPAALFLHVFLAFPDGRLRSRFERVLVATTYVAALGLQVLRMSLGAFDNSLQVSASPGTTLALFRIELLSVSALLVIGVGVLVLRRHRAGRPRRRSLGLVIDLFALGLLLAASLFAIAVFEWPGYDAFVVVQRATWIVVGLAPIVFLLGLLDARLARSDVGELIIGLRAGLPPAAVQEALARTLRDPSLTLAYWLPDFDTYVDLDGRPVDVPSPDGRATKTIDVDGRRVAALLCDPALVDEPELLDAVGAAAGIALENARLQAELAARLEEVKGSRARVLEAGQEERKRLERDLHDGAQQRLVALSLQLKLLERQLGDRPGAAASVAQAQREVSLSLEDLRDLAHGLHPAVLTAHGLPVALEQVAARAPVPVRLDVQLDERLPEPVEVAAYFVVTESLANVAKHARATEASVAVARSGDTVAVEITDDGVGGVDAEGSGLRGLADRVEALGGALHVWSPDGRGTRVRAELPCA
jgi:signal transduction histidine kinase